MKATINSRVKMIVLDLDGTIVDLYAVPNWLGRIRAEDPNPYREAKPMWDMVALNMALERLQLKGWEINIVTWLSMDSTEAYKTEVRKAKLDWLKAHDFCYDHFYGVQYGTTKANPIRKRCEYGILVDDNAKIREGWTLGEVVDPTAVNLIRFLEELARD